MTALKVLDRAARLLLFPIRLSPDYSFNQISIPRALQAGVVSGALVALAIGWGFLRAWSVPRRFAMAALAAVAWLPAANLLFPLTTLFGERLLYLPSVGLAVILGDVVVSSRLWRDERTRRAATALLGIAIVLWSARTVDRNLDWRSQRSLFEAAARTSPLSARVRMNHGVELLAAGEVERAIRELEAATTILPSYANAHYNLSLAYERAERFGDAEAAIRAAIVARGDRAAFWVHLGRILGREGKDAEAASAFRQALALDPGNAEAQAGLQ